MKITDRKPMPMKRERDGLYSKVTTQGRRVEVEWMLTAYGDSGWVYWIDGERSDYPVDTKRYAVYMLQNELLGLGDSW